MATSSNTTANSTSSGIITDTATGERHIPASMRADGSTRREIRIRPGYRPPEDVEVYKNRTAEAWKTRGSGGVPGADSAGGEVDFNKAGAPSAASAKNAKRREARKRAKAAEATGAEELKVPESQREEPTDEPESQPEVAVQGRSDSTPRPEGKKDAEEAERNKRARKLRKKLREARELQEKKEKGEGLLQEQFDKVIKINELIRDLDKLGFDASGEPKEKSTEGADDLISA